MEKSMVQGRTCHPSVEANDSPLWSLNQLNDLVFAANLHWMVSWCSLFVTMLPWGLCFSMEKSMVQGPTCHSSVEANDSPLWSLNQLSDLVLLIRTGWLTTEGYRTP